MLKKVSRVIKCNQKSWLKPYIDMNNNLREAAKNDFEKDYLFNFFKNYLKPNYHTTKFLIETLLAIEIKKLKFL